MKAAKKSREFPVTKNRAPAISITHVHFPQFPRITQFSNKKDKKQTKSFVY